MNRRNFLGTMLALGAAPAIVRAESLMRIVVLPLIVWGDGVHDDTEALQAFFDGRRVVRADGTEAGDVLRGGVHIVSKTIYVRPTTTVRLLTDSRVHGKMGDFAPMFSVSASAPHMPIHSSHIYYRNG